MGEGVAATSVTFDGGVQRSHQGVGGQRGSHSGGRIETLLNDMERRRVAPESIFYGVVINAYANGGHVNAARSAEKILRRMERAVDAGGRSGATDSDVQPGTQGV